MNHTDLKRLVAGFLVLSAITGTATLISLNFVGNGSSSERALQVEGVGGNNPLSTIGKNAFVEKLPSNGGLGANSDFTQTGGYVSDSSNLTKNFAGVFASKMIENNPSGPQVDENGNPTVLNLPGEDKAEDMIKEALSKTTLAFDDKTTTPVYKISKSFAPDDVSAYLKQVYEILGQVSSSTKASLGVAQQNQTADALVLPALAIESALAKLSSLSVPQPFAEVHTTLLRFFANQKNVFYAVTDYQSDPLKTIVALQNEKEIISRDVALIQNAISKVDQKSLSLNNVPEWQKLYSEIFGVKKAYAGLFDAGYGTDATLLAILGEAITNTAQWIANKLDKITEWLYDTALSIAVNLLINEFQNQVVNWIAGNGKPKFITNWNGFLSDVANKAAGQVIYNAIPQLCTGLGPLIRATLLPVERADTGVRCTLNQVISNVNSFFNRFQNGGWVAYGYAMQPNNNYYGNLIELYDEQMREAVSAMNAAEKEAIASKGYLAVKRCVDERINEETGDKYCAREEASTPGAAVGETLTTSLGWAGNKIISAKRFEALVAAIVNASINRIMKEGLSSLTEAMNPTPPQFNNATPRSVTNPSNLGGTITSVNRMVSSLNQAGVFQQNQIIINSDTQWLTLKPGMLNVLNRLSTACSNQSGDANQRIADLNSLAPTVQEELNNANTIQNAKNAAATASSTQDIMNVLAPLQNIDIGKLFSAATAAQTRLTAMQNIQTASTDMISNGCVGSVPSATSTAPTP